MAFEEVCRIIKVQPVAAGMERMQPNMRELVQRLLARFREQNAELLSVDDEAAAMALWGAAHVAKFHAWHREQGGLPRVLEILIAMSRYKRVTYEWDDSVWTLRRASPTDGVWSLGSLPWFLLRDALADATPAEVARTRAVAEAAQSRAWPVRAAMAFVFPEEKAFWTEDDDATLRHVDVDDYPTQGLGLLVSMRHAHVKIPRGPEWDVSERVSPAMLVKELGDSSTIPLRLLRAHDALAALGVPDALRALAEFADAEAAWTSLAALAPSEHTLRALAPLFTTARPRRTLGVHLARGLFHELVVAAPEAAQKLARGAGEDAELVRRVLEDTGATLPTDAAWTSPWDRTPAKKKAPPAPRATKGAAASSSASSASSVSSVPFTEKMHWRTGELEKLAEDADGRGAKADKKHATECREAIGKSEKAFMISLHWMTDAGALRIWNEIPPKHWYGQVDDVQTMLARFGLAELPSVLAFVQTKPDTLAALAHVESPRVAPLMARAFALLKKQKDLGAAWLDRFPHAAAVGLVPERASSDKQRREAAEKALAHVARGNAAAVERALGDASPGGAQTVMEELRAPPELPGKRPKLPDFLDITRLPRPITKDGKAALAEGAQGELLQLLKATLPDGHPALDAVLEDFHGSMTSESLARFAWSVFRQWLFAGAPAKERWALHALGRFPADENATALGKLARVWARRGNSSRAQEAVETLGVMGTQTALLEIYDISRKVQSKALKARAEKVFATVAKAHGLSETDLADRLVPDLTEEALTFGDLRASFDAHARPFLVDEKGTRCDKPTFADESDGKRWADLKKLGPKVGRAQLARLESMMVMAGRMSFEHFSEVYLMHAILRAIARHVVWGAYKDGKLIATFTPEEAGTVDAAGARVNLSADATYGVVHPAELAAPDLARWRERLPEQPFEQLQRRVFPAKSLQLLTSEAASWIGRDVPTGSLLGFLSRGWTRGDALHGGCYVHMTREGGGLLAAVVFTPGIYLGGPNENAVQTIEAVELRMVDNDTQARVPPSILSEIQRDFALLT